MNRLPAIILVFGFLLFLIVQSLPIYMITTQRESLQDKIKQMEVEAVERGYGQLVIDPETKDYIFNWKEVE